jgi:hypothetical protein
MRRVGLIGDFAVTNLFLTLLRTEANKDRRGWGGAFAVRNGRKNESPLGSAPNFGTPNGLFANSAVASSPNPLSWQFQRRCKCVNRRMSFVGVFQVGCEQSGVISGHDGS